MEADTGILSVSVGDVRARPSPEVAQRLGGSGGFAVSVRAAFRGESTECASGLPASAGGTASFGGLSLEEDALSGLAAESLALELWLEAAGEGAEEFKACCGRAEVPLRPLLAAREERIAASVAFRPEAVDVGAGDAVAALAQEPNAEGDAAPAASATVVLETNEALADALLGGLVLSAGGVTLHRPPGAFLPVAAVEQALQSLSPDASEEDAKALVEERVKQTHERRRAALSLRCDLLPPFAASAGEIAFAPATNADPAEADADADAAKDDDGVEGAPAGGKGAEAAPETAAVPHGGSEEAAATPGGAPWLQWYSGGTWTVAFPPTPCVFLTRRRVQLLAAALESGGATLEGVLYFGEPLQLGAPAPAEDAPAPNEKAKKGKKARKGKKGKAEPAPEETQADDAAPAEPAWLCQCAIPLAALAQEGARTATADAPLQDALGLPVPWHPAAGAAGADADAVSAALSLLGEDALASLGTARRAALASAASAVSVTVTASAPIVAAARERLGGGRSALSPADVVPERSVRAAAATRDPAAELRGALRSMASEIAEEYALLHGPADDDGAATGRDAAAAASARREKLVYALNVSGVYHSLKERLKPFVQRYARHRLDAHAAEGAGAEDGADGEERQRRLLSQLYVQLQSELAEALAQTARSAHGVAPSLDDAARAGAAFGAGSAAARQARFRRDEAEIGALRALALDSEANGAFAEAERLLTDALAVSQQAAEEAPAGAGLLVDCWKALAALHASCARALGAAGDAEGRALQGKRAFAVLREVVALAEEDAGALGVAAACALEAGSTEGAQALLDGALALQCGDDFSDVFASERALEQRADPATLCLRMLLCDALGNATAARQCLRLAVSAHERACAPAGAVPPPGDVCRVLGDPLDAFAAPLTPPPASGGGPKRTAVSVLQDGAELCCNLGCASLAARLLALADLSEKTAQQKALERGTSVATPPRLRLRGRVLASRLALLRGDREGAAALAQDACDMASPPPPSAHLALADACDAGGDGRRACDAYASALSSLEGAGGAPRRVYARLGGLRLSLGEVREGKDCYLRCADAWQSCSAWLGAGVASLRLEQLAHAEEALREANARDERNARVWGYLALLSLGKGRKFREDARAAIARASRLGLADAPLLREIATSLVAVDELATAEDLLRRAVACAEDRAAQVRAKKSLADVLAAQNNAAAAVAEYREVLGDEEASEGQKEDAGAAARRLLRSLGREDEASALEGP